MNDEPPSGSWLEAVVRPSVRGLRPYTPGKPIEEVERELGIVGAIKLASNENPLGPSPRALAAAAAAVGDVASYPDAGQVGLRGALAAHYQLTVGEVLPAAGADELIYMLVRAFCRPGLDEVVTPRFGFISYRLASQVQEVTLRETAVDACLKPDVDALLAACGPATRLVFLGQPNNPSGTYLERAALTRVLAEVPRHAIVVLDEAYVEYARALCDDFPDGVELYRARAREALVVLRTFSKAYGLAGLRVGYGVCDAGVAGYLDRVRQPFNVNALAQAAAIAALGDPGHVARTVELTRRGVEQVRDGLARLGLEVKPTATNFVLVDLGRDAAPVYQALLERGVIVRPLAAWGLPHHLRVTIGTAEQCDRMIAALGDVLA